MKPYNERLTLIDEAIDYYDGVFPSVTGTEQEYWFKSTGVLCKKYLTGDFTRGLVDVATKQEFEQRVKEREAMENKSDWHEKGELPPVGEAVLTSMGEGKVIACSIDGSVCVLVNNHLHIYHRKALKPVPPEREQLISALTELNHYDGMVISKKTAIAIVDAGWRPTEKKDD